MLLSVSSIVNFFGRLCWKISSPLRFHPRWQGQPNRVSISYLLQQDSQNKEFRTRNASLASAAFTPVTSPASAIEGWEVPGGAGEREGSTDSVGPVSAELWGLVAVVAVGVAVGVDKVVPASSSWLRSGCSLDGRGTDWG